MPHFDHTWVWMAPKKKLVDLQSVGHKTAHNIHNKCNEALKAAAQRQWTIWRELGYARGLSTHCLYANSFSHDGILFRHQFIQHVFSSVLKVQPVQFHCQYSFPLSCCIYDELCASLEFSVGSCSFCIQHSRYVVKLRCNMKIYTHSNEIKPTSRFSSMKNIPRNSKSNVCYQSTVQTQYQVI